MKKLIAIISIFVSLSGNFAFGTVESPLGAVSIERLTNSEPAILPSNPFYFFKSWGWGFKKLFANSNLKKLALAFNILDERAAEIKKLGDFKNSDTKLINRTLTAYKSSFLNFSSILDQINPKDINPTGSKVSALLTNIESHLLKHLQFMDDVATYQRGSELALLNEVETAAAESLRLISEKFSTPKELRLNIEAIVKAQKDAYKELRTAEIIDQALRRLEPKDDVSLSELDLQLNILIDNLIIDFSGKLEGEATFEEKDVLLSSLGKVIGNSQRRIGTLAEISERVINPDVKSRLSLMRTELIDSLRSGDSINKLEAEGLSNRAGLFSKNLEIMIVEQKQEVFPIIRQLLDRAKFNFRQSETFITEGNYVGAISQAVISIAASRSGIALLADADQRYQNVIFELRERYDDLAGTMKLSQISGEREAAANQAMLLLADTEKKIAEFSQRVDSHKDPSVLSLNVRNIRIQLAIISKLLGL